MGSMVTVPPSLAPLPARVALVDDDGEFNEFLSEYLRARGAKVRSFRDGESFLKDLEAGAGFDAYIVDLTLPGLDGVDVIAVVRGRDPHTSVLVISGRVGPDAFNSCLAAGADMVIAKPVRFDQVVFALQALERRASASVPSAGPSTLPWRLETLSSTLRTPGGGRVKLSPAEVEFLVALAQRPGASMSRAELARAAGILEDGQRNVDAAMYRMRKRIEAATGELAPVRSVHRVGYVLGVPLDVVKVEPTGAP
jgi:two-component system OmpR family response regulator